MGGSGARGSGGRRSPGEGRGCAERRDRAARNPAGGRRAPLYPRLPLLRSLARRLCASLGISVHVAGSAGRGRRRRRRKGEKGAARSDASRPREPAGSGGGSRARREVGPRRRRAGHWFGCARSRAQRLPRLSAAAAAAPVSFSPGGNDEAAPATRKYLQVKWEATPDGRPGRGEGGAGMTRKVPPPAGGGLGRRQRRAPAPGGPGSGEAQPAAPSWRSECGFVGFYFP
ncbi:protein FAM246C-like [Ammospiza caudacuta]|uniref:protein FAM246C-like n=1 Tax=Ammospiza caudacuta TaxID=2857398 RepID=UPI002739BCAE|nr:protein FAM246C-like [Ammospiza caudacuta]